MRRILGLLAALLLVAVVVVPRFVEDEAEGELAPAAARQPRPTLQVTVERVEPRELVERLATTGTVRAREEVELVSEISGKVERILFDEGRRVGRGALLVKIDDTELRAERERIRLRLELAERREERQRQLFEDGVISQDGYDLVANELAVLRSELALVEAQLEKTEIRAPFAGVVGLRRVSPGSYLTPQTPIATLQDVDAVKLDFFVPEKYAPRLHPGREVNFTVKGSDEEFRGEIYAVEPEVDPETRSLLLRARAPNPGGLLVPGAFADVRLVVERFPAALTVPAIAVVPELGGKKVYVLEDGKAQPRQVTTGLRTEERVQVTSGLAAGETVITSGVQQLREGLEVEAREIRRTQAP